MDVKKSTDTGVHHHVLDEVVRVVGETKQDFLVLLSLERNLKLWLLALVVKLGLDGLGLESKFQDCLGDVSLAGGLCHDHLDLASLDDVVVEFDTVAVKGVQWHSVVLLMDKEAGDDHGQGDWAGVLMLQDKMLGDLECHLKHVVSLQTVLLLL